MIAGVWLFENGQVEIAARHGSHPIPRERVPGAQDLDPLIARGELSRLMSRARSRGHGRGSFVWIDVLDPTPAEMARLADVFRLAPLQVEDCLNPKQRPKIERGRTTFLVVRSVSYLDATSDIETHQVSAFVGAGFLITVSHGQYDIADAMQERLAREPALRRLGTAAAFYALLDTVVDQYLAVSEEIAIDIEQIEESVFSPERTNDAERIYRLKRENLEVRRAVGPLASAARSLMRLEVPEIDGSLRPYYSDVADHLLRAAELAEGHDQLLMTMLMASTARQDLQQNMDMRRISAWVAIAAIPTLLAGIYGMNFDFMPELHWRLGYPLVMAVMVVSGLLLYRAFRRAKWL